MPEEVYTPPSYGPNQNPGDVRRRVWRVQGDNKLAGVPFLQFLEEDAIMLGDGSERSLNRARDLCAVYTPGVEVPMRDPVTDEFTGAVITHAQIFAAIYSLGRYAQGIDDQAKIETDRTSTIASDDANQ